MPAIWKLSEPDDPMYKEGWSSFRPNWGPRSFEVVGGKFRWLLPPPQQGEKKEGRPPEEPLMPRRRARN